MNKFHREDMLKPSHTVSRRNKNNQIEIVELD